jgi:hypothetical protein
MYIYCKFCRFCITNAWEIKIKGSLELKCTCLNMSVRSRSIKHKYGTTSPIRLQLYIYSYIYMRNEIWKKRNAARSWVHHFKKQIKFTKADESPVHNVVSWRPVVVHHTLLVISWKVLHVKVSSRSHYMFRPTFVIFRCLWNYCWWNCCASVLMFNFRDRPWTMHPYVCYMQWYLI